MSDGLKVVRYVWRPKNVAGKKLPPVIVNRGGNPNLATLTPQSFFYPYVTNGFVVIIGSQYRGADWRSNAGSQSLPLASRLQSLGKTYELHVYAGDDHPLSINRLDREQRIVEWFKKHMN